MVYQVINSPLYFFLRFDIVAEKKSVNGYERHMDWYGNNLCNQLLH